MEFTYVAYRNLIRLLKEKQYSFCNYHDYKDFDKCVILRHDIDNSVEKALSLAQVECEAGVKSTYYVLLKTDFYNPASKKTGDKIRQIVALGHDVGLHFDEVAYLGQDPERLPEFIQKEAKLLSEICEVPVRSFSMHRPNQLTIEKNLEVPGFVNSYGEEFFRGFKYLSDSRRNWREPVLDIIESEAYDKLHILTHAFWYGEDNVPINDAVRNYILSAKMERYWQLSENIRELDKIVSVQDIAGNG